jgi:hypothetical protein
VYLTKGVTSVLEFLKNSRVLFLFCEGVTLVGAAIQPVQMGLLDGYETIISFVYVYMKQSYIYVYICMYVCINIFATSSDGARRWHPF